MQRQHTDGAGAGWEMTLTSDTARSGERPQPWETSRLFKPLRDSLVCQPGKEPSKYAHILKFSLRLRWGRGVGRKKRQRAEAGLGSGTAQTIHRILTAGPDGEGQGQPPVNNAWLLPLAAREGPEPHPRASAGQVTSHFCLRPQGAFCRGKP